MRVGVTIYRVKKTKDRENKLQNDHQLVERMGRKEGGKKKKYGSRSKNR